MPQVSSRRAYRAAQATSATPGTGQASAPTPRAGRNLPAAIAVGLVLGVLIVGTAVIYTPAFAVLVTAAVSVGAWELIEALRASRIEAPLVPTMTGAICLVPLAYVTGTDGLMLGFFLVVCAILLWRAAGGLTGALRDVAGGVFVTAYVPLLAGFVGLMLSEPEGSQRALVFIIVTAMSDIGGYAVGVVAGRHPMAPSVSPKKSWEGFAGSVAWCVVAGALTVPLMLDGPWWAGVLLGLSIAVMATVGDLAESTLKRDLGIKDMSTILPGHGGVMDRLDSMLVCAPVAWLLLWVLVPH